MILAHIEYCITSWSYTSYAAIGPIEVRALKILDKKPSSYHHCNILDKYKFLNLANFKFLKSACLIYKVILGELPFHRKLHHTRGLAPGIVLLIH